MKKAALLGVLAFGWASHTFSQIPGGYYDNAQGLTGQELKDSLNNIIDGHTEFPYTSTNTDVWDILKAADYDPDTPTNVILIYSGWSVNAAQEYNGGDGWTREHIWAKQHGDFGTTKGAGTDCHNLRPADVSTNSDKNNRWFEESPTPHKDNSGYIGSADSLTGSYWSDTDWYWEPRDDAKGDVARALFYMAVRYEGANGEPDLEVVDTIPSDNNTKEPVHARLSTLLAWHNQDPVSDYERRRHDTVAAYQQNRNPFIDHPEWVCDIWGGVCTAAGTTETFDNFTESTSYNSGSFTGVGDVTWTYTKSKGTPAIEGNSIVLGKGYTPAAGFSGTIQGGCANLSFDYMQAYSTGVNFEVYVNENLVATVDSSVQSQSIAASFTVNVKGDVDLEIKQKNTSAGQVTIDNLTWTPYSTTTIENFDNFKCDIFNVYYSLLHSSGRSDPTALSKIQTVSI